MFHDGVTQTGVEIVIRYRNPPKVRLEICQPRKFLGQRTRAFLGPYAVPLELLGVLLVIALLGALYFARED